MNTCYVCSKELDTATDAYCYKDGEDGDHYIYRCLWHGLPGIERTVYGASRGGYAKTLEEAKERAEEQLSSPYVAPELKEGERAILKEVERLLGG